MEIVAAKVDVGDFRRKLTLLAVGIIQMKQKGTTMLEEGIQSMGCRVRTDNMLSAILKINLSDHEPPIHAGKVPVN